MHYPAILQLCELNRKRFLKLWSNEVRVKIKKKKNGNSEKYPNTTTQT